MKRICLLVLMMSMLTPTGFAQAKSEDGVKIADQWLLGRVEWLWLPALGDNVKARIDSGAKTSSMSATEIEEFERDGRRHVRFSFSHQHHQVRLEAPLSRYVRIRQANSKQLDRRPVVLLPVQLGGMIKEVEFTLKDRTRMLYPVLLGREFMGRDVLIDPSRRFIQPAREK
ncbi:ATP-dependent zinc protease family protein [Zobellella taiwanensis]|jgi:hypothetical protein|nr:ATP-dependent zinc protease [Zobellella taiwanensis]